MKSITPERAPQEEEDDHLVEVGGRAQLAMGHRVSMRQFSGNCSTEAEADPAAPKGQGRGLHRKALPSDKMLGGKVAGCRVGPPLPRAPRGSKADFPIFAASRSEERAQDRRRATFRRRPDLETRTETPILPTTSFS